MLSLDEFLKEKAKENQFAIHPRNGSRSEHKMLYDFIL